MRAPHDPVAAAKWRPPLWLRSGSDGTFATRSLPRTVDTAVWTRAPGHVLQVGGATIDPERGADVRVVLQPGASLRGRVLDPHGGVVAHARLALRDDHYDRPAVDLFAPGFGQSVAHSDAAGEFAIDALLPVPLHVVVEAPDGRMASTVLTPRAGETLTWNPIVDAPRAWRGVLRDAGGVPLSDYRIELRTPPGWHLPEPVRTDAEGRFTLERLEDCDYWVVVWRPAGQWPAPAMIRGPLRAGPAPFDLTLSDSALASAQVRVRVVDESGRAGEVAVMLEDAERRRLRVALPSTPSVYRSVTLPPGAYRLCVVHGTSFAAGGETFELGAGAVLDLGELRLPPPGTLRLRLDRAGGATRRQDELVISGADGRTLQTGIVENGSAAVPLFPGRYFVHVRDETPAAAWPSVEIHSNATTELVLTLPPSFPRRFVLTHADDGDDLRVAWTWSDPEGRVLCRKDGMWKRHANFVQEIEQRFVPGRYRVAVECSKGRRATVEFEVDDREPPADAFELRLR
jgi:catechol 2,3-dioxygenase-like lactoylglutathione lyase family enzyme